MYFSVAAELLPDGQQTKTAIVWNDTVLAQHDNDTFTHSHARLIMTYKISSQRYLRQVKAAIEKSTQGELPRLS